MTDFTEFTEVTARPDDVPAGEPGECLTNAYIAAELHGWHYAEGIAKRGLFWYRHAWNVDERGRVIDITWDSQPGSRYVGRIIDDKEEPGMFELDGPVVPEGEIGIDCLSQREIDWLSQARQRE